MRAADARFEHAAAPYGNAMFLTDIVDALGFGESAHAAEFDVDDSAGLDSIAARHDAPSGCTRRGRWAFRFALELGVIDDVIVSERLLDHHQVEVVELLQERSISRKA